MRSAYQSPRASEWLSRQTGIPAIVLPHTVGSVDGTDDLFAVFETVLSRLEEVVE